MFDQASRDVRRSRDHVAVTKIRGEGLVVEVADPHQRLLLPGSKGALERRTVGVEVAQFNTVLLRCHRTFKNDGGLVWIAFCAGNLLKDG